MDDSQFDIDKIDRYLNGELPGEEAAYIKRKIETDSTFREKVDFHQKVVEGLKKAGSEKLKDELNDIYHTHLKDDQHGNTPLYYKIAAAVAILLIAGIAVYFILPTNNEPITFKKKLNVQGSALGFTEGNELEDSITFSIIQSEQGAKAEYTFEENEIKLSIAESIDPQEISILFVPEKNHYLLHIKDTSYRVYKGFDSFQPLEK